MNDRLEDIGERLDVDKKDLREIKREKKKQELLYYILGFAGSLFVLVLTHAYWDSTTPTYPYAGAAAPLGVALSKEKIQSRNMFIALAIMFLITISLAIEFYLSIPSAYGVYSREGKK